MENLKDIIPSYSHSDILDIAPRTAYINDQMISDNELASTINRMGLQQVLGSSLKSYMVNLAELGMLLEQIPVIGEKATEKLYGDFLTLILCPFCQSLFTRIKNGEIPDPVALYECPKCGFWKLIFCKASTSFGELWTARVGKIVEYPLTSKDIPIEELQRYITRNPGLIKRINPTALELLVTEIFKTSPKYEGAMHVGQTADGGVDIILVAYDSKKTLVQVKRRGNKRGESVETVRNLLGAMVVENALKGIVVSTADHFTWHATKLVTKLRKIKPSYEIELIDFGKLRELVGTLNITPAWSNHLNDFPDHFYRNEDEEDDDLSDLGFDIVYY